jgi:hypothetical protein
MPTSGLCRVFGRYRPRDELLTFLKGLGYQWNFSNAIG